MELAIKPLSATTTTTATAARAARNQKIYKTHMGAAHNSNSLALLASLTLQKALNINNDSNNVQSNSSIIANMTTTTTSTTKTNTVNTSRKTSAPANISSLCLTTTNNNQTTTTLTAAQQQQQQQSCLSTTSSSTLTNTTTTNTCTSKQSNQKHSFKIPSDILDDLASRFIINVPDMELSNLIRICFQIELAHWFYLDFFCASQEEKKLQPCGIKQFAMQIFQVIYIEI